MDPFVVNDAARILLVTCPMKVRVADPDAGPSRKRAGNPELPKIEAMAY
jgi:hypothetical protein